MRNLKNVLATLTICLISLASFAQTTYQYEDVWGNNYKSLTNLYNDTDNDGVINYFDKHDQNPNVTVYDTPSYSYPEYYNNYDYKTYDYSSGKTIYTGPRGGKYYINSHGIKSYIGN